MKICIKCKVEKDVIYFSKNKSKKDGLSTECKDCVKHYNNQYYKINKKEHNNKSSQYRKNNIDKIKILDKQYREAHQEKIKQYREQNKKENSQRNKKWCQNNKVHRQTYRIKYIKIRRLIDPAFKLRNNISQHINKALKNNNSSKNKKSYLKYITYTIQELKGHLQNQFEPWMSWNNWGTYNSKTWDDYNTLTWYWQLDHIIPQSDLPYTSMEDDNFKKCWSLNNLRPYSAKQNIIDKNRKNK